MGIFDAYVTRLAEFVRAMNSGGRNVRTFDCPSSVRKLLEGLLIGVGDEAGSGVILRGDAFVELGNPATVSSSFIIWTDDPALITDGRITLVGPDIPEAPDASLPFGQVIMVAGADLGGEEQERLERSQHVSDRIEGYMIRSMPQRTWSRVSKHVVEKGFCFETLGRALMAIFKSELPQIKAMEILFVTSCKEDVQELDGIVVQVRKIWREIRNATWKSRGYDIECMTGWGCSNCPDKPVCDGIKEVVTVSKAEQ